MNYIDSGFRFFYHRFVVFDKSIIADDSAEYQKYDKADGVITYGYIDHERGFTFDVLGLISNSEGKIKVIEAQPEAIRTIIRAEAIAEKQAQIINDDEEFMKMYEKHLQMIRSTYENDKAIEESREMSFLDDLRDPYYIDDVQVYLFKDGLDPQLCWIRISGHEEHYLTGILLNEPDQDFDYHEGEEVIFSLKKMQDETWMAICDLNPTRRLKRSDLEGGRLLKQALIDFNKERNEANYLELMELLRDAVIILPCRSVSSQDEQMKLVPDVLKSDDEFFMPVFSSSEEMKDYAKDLSQIETEFLSVVELALNADDKLSGIVVDPFSESFILDKQLMETVRKLKSRIVEE